MKNSNGFTVVELIATFALTMVISIFLFETLLEVKDIFVDTAIKTSIGEKTAIISKNIKSIISKDGSNTITCSSNTCTINGKTLTVNQTSVVVNGQKFSFPKDGDNYVKASNINLSAPSCTNDCYLKISFKLTSNNLSKPYNYSVVFYYMK